MEKDDQQHSQSEPMLTDESTVLQPDLFSGSPVVIAEPVDPTEAAYPSISTHKAAH